jgi:hypothetical protein
MIYITDNFEQKDYDELRRLEKTYWGPMGNHLPPRADRVIDALVKDESRIIGYGQVTHFAEAQLFLNPDTRKRERAQATKLLMSEAFRGAEDVRAQKLYAFIRDPDFSLLIQKHYDFRPRGNPGELLVRSMI